MTTTRTYWLMFRNSENENFAKYFLKEGFHHIDILTRDCFNWIFFSPRNNRFEWEIMNYAITDDVPKLFQVNNPEFTMLKVETKIVKNKHGNVEHGSRPNLSFLHPLNCVGITKYCLGIWPLVWSPWQLYNWLLNKENNCLEVTEII